MGYHEDTDWIWKIWDVIGNKIREATSATFDETFSNKKSEELFESFADDSDQESDVNIDTNSELDNSESVSDIQRPLSHLILSLLSLPSLLLLPSSLTLPQLPQFVQI